MSRQQLLNIEKHKNVDDLKKKLWDELIVKSELFVDGLNYDPSFLKSLDVGGKYMEQVHVGFEMDLKTHIGVPFPVAFFLPQGLLAPFKWNPAARYLVKSENSHYILLKDNKKLFNINFLERPKYYAKKTSDNEPMSHVGAFFPNDCVSVCYSNECSLKDRDEDCRYCNINATKDNYGEVEGIFWKNPKQIGETVAAAYKEGVASRVNITGGFIPERREVDYYLDVAEEIRNHTGLENFFGNATIGAPQDYSVIDKYKEAGYRSMGINIEIWDKNIWKTICPGKDRVCGSWENWVGALEYAVKVFGRGRVRSNIVAGIEPKQKTLEGVEYLASKGVLCSAGPWCPNPGSPLEGHRTPEPAWHLDMAKKIVAIWKKYGFTYQQVHDVFPSDIGLEHDVWRIEDGLFPVSQYAK